MDIAAKAIKPGVTADEIDRIVHEVHVFVHAWNWINLFPFSLSFLFILLLSLPSTSLSLPSLSFLFTPLPFLPSISLSLPSLSLLFISFSFFLLLFLISSFLLPLFLQACIERNCYPSPLNYCNFPKSCCT